MLPNITQCCPMLPNIAKCCSSLPNITQYCPMFPYSVQYCFYNGTIRRRSGFKSDVLYWIGFDIGTKVSNTNSKIQITRGVKGKTKRSKVRSSYRGLKPLRKRQWKRIWFELTRLCSSYRNQENRSGALYIVVILKIDYATKLCYLHSHTQNI